MTGSKVNQARILEGTFRANPEYEMVLFDRLPEEQRTLLADLEKDPDFYGILRPRPGAALATKSVCRDTALLFATLAEPGPIPRYVVRQSGAEARRAVTELVMDGVLAIGTGETWVSGAAALALFGPAASNAPDPGRRLARMSWDAVQYAASLSATEAATLAGRLYNYNSLPLSPVRLASLTTSAELERAYPPKPNEWTALPPTPKSEGWSAWRSRRMANPRQQTGSLFKLYTSPMPEALPEAFQAVVAAAGDWGALQFKIGRRGHGLLRPDKLVAYFPSFSALERAAEQIRRATGGCPAQGVPFTATVGGEEDGLLSWGFDPPPDPAAPEWLRGESWRLKLANRLGSALAMFKTNPSTDVTAVDFAFARIRLEGVDTATWSPLGERQQQEVQR